MKLSLSRGMTVNLGNYESARFDVSLEETFDEITPRTEAYKRLAGTLGIMERDERDRIEKELKH